MSSEDMLAGQKILAHKSISIIKYQNMIAMRNFSISEEFACGATKAFLRHQIGAEFLEENDMDQNNVTPISQSIS